MSDLVIMSDFFSKILVMVIMSVLVIKSVLVIMSDFFSKLNEMVIMSVLVIMSDWL